MFINLIPLEQGVEQVGWDQVYRNMIPLEQVWVRGDHVYLNMNKHDPLEINLIP